MPQFILDTAGAVPYAPHCTHHENQLRWSDLDPFTAGYIEALFFTEQADGDPQYPDSASGLWRQDPQTGDWSTDPGFADLAPETLASILADCQVFQEANGHHIDAAGEEQGYRHSDHPRIAAGRDFWYTRNGHGCGFWDGDWPEPYATQLDAAARSFGESCPYVGDDGQVYL